MTASNEMKSPEKKKVLAFGEIIWDVYPDRAVIGGAPLNFAAHTVRCGADCDLVSAVGRDELGGRALGELARFGIGTSAVGKNEKCTGQCLVTLDARGIPHYRVLTDTAYDHIALTPELTAAAETGAYDALYFGTLASRSADSARALRLLTEIGRFPEVVCDVNLREGCYSAETVHFCLSHATVLKFSAEEEPLMRRFGFYQPEDDSPSAVARAVGAAFPRLRTVLITLGADGSFARDTATGAEVFQPAVGTKVVSTVGAGDSYTAAFTAEYLRGGTLSACMRRAAALSGFVVSRLEAVPDGE